jgi:phage terminase small subunit
MNDYGLTIKQQKFAEAYVATNDASKALIDAGYAPVVRTDTGELDKSKTAKRAQQYLSNPKIRAYVETIREEVIEKVSWTAEKVIDKMYQTYLRATDNDDYTNANRSMESIAKHLGMFVDKKEIKQEFSSMTGSSDDDIQKLADVIGLKVVKSGTGT